VSAPRRAAVIGTGLIGTSIGYALRDQGWYVTGYDTVDEHAHTALRLGALDEVGRDPIAEITFVATPEKATIDDALDALATTRANPSAVVTDVAGVKAPVMHSVADPRFVGGHPMAGNEFSGPDAASPALFRSAAWVLTTLPGTDPRAVDAVKSTVESFGASVMTLTPEEHDVMAAAVSHVPQLTAAALMNLAQTMSRDHEDLLQMVAGGFRDTTRVAACNPESFLDIASANSENIAAALDRLIAELQGFRLQIAGGDREELRRALTSAAVSRTALANAGR
jgi:prephenate dehydrogenase